MKPYCPDPFNYRRRPSSPVDIGGRVVVGGDRPILVQSMTTTSTLDTEASAQQVLRVAAAGAGLVRLTAQGRPEAEKLAEIRGRIEAAGCTVPLVADIHFNPQAALVAARTVSKVRINPGNFVDKRATLTGVEYSEAQYAEELERLREALTALLAVCRQHGTALRIGVNHGSLSDRILSRYGDTPAGMVESAMEFLRVCRGEGFDRVVVSMKSSNTRVMVEANRLLAARMEQEGMSYPIHLGVTEAGEGEEGRIRSAVGIGSLLADGIGDTIRVSLTEPPENEIVPAKLLADYFADRAGHRPVRLACEPLPYDPFCYARRPSREVACGGIRVGGAAPVAVIAQGGDLSPEEEAVVAPPEAMQGRSGWIACTFDQMDAPFLAWLAHHPDRVLVLSSDNRHWVGELRACFVQLMRNGLPNPAIIRRRYTEPVAEALQIHAAADFGALLIDGFGDGVWIENAPAGTPTPQVDLAVLSLAILQAARRRITATDIISCPGCGRTLFDLQQTARAVKARFAGRPGLKIAVMGCIVNGPGEMADADYGYVGAGPGRVTLYRGREVVERNIPESEALDRLEQLINRDR